MHDLHYSRCTQPPIPQILLTHENICLCPYCPRSVPGLSPASDYVGSLFQFNIGEYGELTDTYACGESKSKTVAGAVFFVFGTCCV